MKIVASKKDYLSKETDRIVITEKNLIEILTKRNDINEMRLYLDHKNQIAVYEADYSGFCVLHNDIFYNHVLKIIKPILLQIER